MNVRARLVLMERRVSIKSTLTAACVNLDLMAKIVRTVSTVQSGN